jgi:glycosyltransferase involved in cell wall biosynthesis
MPTVSVILTSYNHASYLRESIESVLAQTYRDFELILVDDASTDDSWRIIQSYADPRIIAIRNEKNMRSRGWYRVIEETASGRYIAMHHSDDAWMPEKLELQVPVLDRNPEVAAVFTRAHVIDDQGKPFKDADHFYYGIFDQPNRTRHAWLNFFFFNGNALCHPSVLIRKACYRECGLFDYVYAALPDFLKWVKICLRHEIHVLPAKLTLFRVHKNEQNASGYRHDTVSRGTIEYFMILNQFLQIKSPDEFIKVFPRAKEFQVKGEFVPEFALARICLESPSNIHYLYGLCLLFDLINDTVTAPQIERLYQYTHMDLIAGTGKRDVFHAVPSDRHFNSKIYLDTGSGYSGNETIETSSLLPARGEFSHRFDVKAWRETNGKSKIVSVRWDPCEGRCCRCRIERVQTDGEYRGIRSRNALHTVDGWDEFWTIDPIYEFDGDFSCATWLIIEGRFEAIPLAQITQALSTQREETIALHRRAEERDRIALRQTLDACQREADACRQGMNDKQNELDRLGALINAIDRSFSWQITRPLRYLKRQMKKTIQFLGPTKNKGAPDGSMS